MPLTEFQIAVLRLIAEHRNPNSYVAGGIAINRELSSYRHSNDIDFFHDTDEAVAYAVKVDLALLDEHNFSIKILIQQPSFVRCVVSKNGESLKLEWVRDTAFRFFPAIEDETLGFRLHDVDSAVNKCLALSNRSEVRDIIDLLQLQESVLSLPAACWAACGKDPGFSPSLLVECMSRHSIIRPEQLEAESLVHPIDPIILKKNWMAQLEQVEAALAGFPAEDLGCLYLSGDGEVVREPIAADLDKYVQHFGSIGGSWPEVV